MNGIGGHGGIQIPVIDIPQSSNTEATGLALVDACAKYGFVFVKGKTLGFTPDILNETFELVRIPECEVFDLESNMKQSKTFFGSPVIEKEKCAIQENVTLTS